MSYRGNSGAVAIGYNNVGSNTSQLIQVYKSTFFNNSANANASFQTSSNTFTDRVHTGRGGALAVYQNSSRNLSIIISKCNFTKNYARSYGGGLYLNAFTNYLLVERTTINLNTAELGGGGIAFWRPVVILVKCNITHNRAFAGGGILVNTNSTGKYRKLY